MPLVGGFLGLALLPIVPLLPDNDGEALTLAQALVNAPVTLGLFLAAILFALSGIGWMIVERTLLGLAILIVRLYIASWVFAWVAGGAEGSSFTEGVFGYAALIAFVLSMAISSVSVIALAYRTRPSHEARLPRS